MRVGPRKRNPATPAQLLNPRQWTCLERGNLVEECVQHAKIQMKKIFPTPRSPQRTVIRCGEQPERRRTCHHPVHTPSRQSSSPSAAPRKIENDSDDRPLNLRTKLGQSLLMFLSPAIATAVVNPKTTTLHLLPILVSLRRHHSFHSITTGMDPRASSLIIYRREPYKMPPRRKFSDHWPDTLTFVSMKIPSGPLFLLVLRSKKSNIWDKPSLTTAFQWVRRDPYKLQPCFNRGK